MLPVAWVCTAAASGAWPLAVAAILAIVAALMSGRHESDAVVDLRAAGLRAAGFSWPADRWPADR